MKSRWILALGLVVSLLVVGGLGALIGINGVGWWNQRKLDRMNMDASVLILQYNLQQGRLLMPPQLQQAAVPPPAVAPPAAPKPAEAAPAKK